MKIKTILILIPTFITLFSSNVYAGGLFSRLWNCPYPVEAVMHTLDCVEKEMPGCASAGYARNFVMLHNGEDTDTDMTLIFWIGAFFVLDFDMEFSQVEQVGDNKVLLEYVETVTTRSGQVLFQHETALVTLNSVCQIKVWDQTGDDEEQQAVFDAVAEEMGDIYDLIEPI